MPLNPVTNPVAKQALREFQVGDDVIRLVNAAVICTDVFGVPVFFTVASPKDHIQNAYHAKGKFYEEEELEIIRKAFRPGDCFVDIGANVGNHALFVAKFLHPREVVVVEPNPVAFKVLLSNILLNRVEHMFDLNWIGSGISVSATGGFGMDFNMKNVGGGRMVQGEGQIPAVPADQVIGDRDTGFIKIDVEGMEMQVLRSLQKTIARCKPRIFIEVDVVNRPEFDAWVEAEGYRSVAYYKRYRPNENFLLVHREDPNWSDQDA